MPLEKPPHGTPCNGCGLCCMAGPCALGQHLWAIEEGRCPALVEVEGTAPTRYACGLVTDPLRFAPPTIHYHGKDLLSAAASHLIGSNVGCDAQLAFEPYKPGFEQKLQAYRDRFAPQIAAALAVWRMIPIFPVPVFKRKP